jgi:hypothetical protein
MPDDSCPQCRGELINDVTNGVWYVNFSTLTTTAANLENDSFELEVLLTNNTLHQQSLAQCSGTPGSTGRTTYSWTITAPGDPLSGTIEVEHETLGMLHQSLIVSEQGSRAA